MRARIGAFLLALGTAAAAAASDGEGERLYRRWCARCHGADALGAGRDAGLFAEPPPPLRGTLVLARHGDAELVAWVREGKKLELGFRPEAMQAHARRTEALYRHLVRLPEVRWDLAGPGSEIWAARCLPCHDDYGHPRADRPAVATAAPRDLSAPAFQESVEEEALRRLVRHERPGLVRLDPPIADDEALRLAAFVRLLSPGYEIYDRFCMACHGPRGEGVPDAAPGSGLPSVAFDSAYFARHGPDWVIDRAWHMLRDAKARMPHLAASLPEGDARAIVRYLQSLTPVKESSHEDPETDRGAHQRR